VGVNDLIKINNKMKFTKTTEELEELIEFVKMDVQKEISLRNAISYCIENNDVNTATNRIMEFIRDEKEAINNTRD
tara:strand:+ start:179 stop:406 length:228 start_codon:yes stop_codon:yes gene_type:complete